MRLDPRLLQQLEERDDANEVLAELLGCCPTCGQKLPEPAKNGVQQRVAGEKRAAVLAWRERNPDGTQSQCARDVGCSLPYVNRIWHENEAKPPRDETDP